MTKKYSTKILLSDCVCAVWDGCVGRMAATNKWRKVFYNLFVWNRRRASDSICIGWNAQKHEFVLDFSSSSFVSFKKNGTKRCTSDAKNLMAVIIALVHAPPAHAVAAP